LFWYNIVDNIKYIGIIIVYNIHNIRFYENKIKKLSNNTEIITILCVIFIPIGIVVQYTCILHS